MGDLYFHIGLHKTGTTYLQSFFRNNINLLKENGVDFYDRYFRLQALFEPFVEKGARYDLADVAQEISSLRSGKLLVSSENLSHFLLREKNIRTFKEVFRTDTVHILVFLRRQDFLKESIFGEAVKHFHTGTIQSEEHYHYDHDRRIAALEEGFGRPFITTHIYQETGDNRLVEKVLHAMGIDVPRDAARDGPRKNVSPHRRKRLLMSAVPKTLDQTRSPLAFRTTQDLIRSIDRSRSIDDDGTRFLMSPTERHRLVADNMAGNRAIVQRYALKDVGEFLSAPDPEAPWTPPAPITLREIVAVGREAIGDSWSGTSRSGTDALRAAVRSAQITRLLGAAWSGRGRAAAPGPGTAPAPRTPAEQA